MVPERRKIMSPDDPLHMRDYLVHVAIFRHRRVVILRILFRENKLLHRFHLNDLVCVRPVRCLKKKKFKGWHSNRQRPRSLSTWVHRDSCIPDTALRFLSSARNSSWFAFRPNMHYRLDMIIMPILMSTYLPPSSRSCRSLTRYATSVSGGSLLRADRALCKLV